MWRVLTGLHRQVTLSFMLVGRTKFAPDWCFVLIKQKFRKTRIGCLDELKTSVEQSAKANYVQLAGDQQGRTIVPIYDWASFLQPHFHNIANLKTYQHFQFSSGSSHVQAQFSADGAEQELKFLRDGWTPCLTTLPTILSPPGLSLERQKYLYEKSGLTVQKVARTQCVPPPPSQ